MNAVPADIALQMDVDKFRRLEGGIILAQRCGDFADEALVARRREADKVGSLHPGFEEAMQSLVVIGAGGIRRLVREIRDAVRIDLQTPIAVVDHRSNQLGDVGIRSVSLQIH